MRAWKTSAGIGFCIVSLCGLAHGQNYDTAIYHGGAVMSPNIRCLLWTPTWDAYSSTEIQTRQDFIIGYQQYLSNAAAALGTNGAGAEPVPRQYGVWGATFSGTCQQDTTAPYQGAYLDFTDNSQNSAIYHEITHVYGSGAFTQNDVILVLTRGWAYLPGGDTRPGHWSVPGTTQYMAAVFEDAHDYGWAAHELTEAVTDPDVSSGWHTDQINCSGVGVEVCDDAGGVRMSRFRRHWPTASVRPATRSTTPDWSITSTGRVVTWACGINNANTCAAVGTQNQCGNVLSNNTFTNMTTTFPVTVVQTGTKTNVLMRTPTGIAHLVSTNGGASYTTVSPAPVGSVTETLAAYSKDGTTIDMFGRGTDGFLYQWTYNGSSWGGPVGLGKYLLGPPSAAWVNINGWQHGLVWVTSNDRQIYLWVTGGGWFTSSMPAGLVAFSPPQVFSRNNTVDIYFTASDGYVYTDQGWTGGWQKLPENGYGMVSATSAPGSQSRADVFAKWSMDFGGSKGTWVEFQSGAAVNHSLLGGSGSPISSAGPIGSANYGGSAKLWLFLTSANNVYLVTSDASGTTFSAPSQVPGAPTVTSPVTTFTPDSNTLLGFARRQSDGHLDPTAVLPVDPPRDSGHGRSHHVRRPRS